MSSENRHGGVQKEQEGRIVNNSIFFFFWSVALLITVITHPLFFDKEET